MATESTSPSPCKGHICPCTCVKLERPTVCGGGCESWLAQPGDEEEVAEAVVLHIPPFEPMLTLMSVRAIGGEPGAMSMGAPKPELSPQQEPDSPRWLMGDESAFLSPLPLPPGTPPRSPSACSPTQSSPQWPGQTTSMLPEAAVASSTASAAGCRSVCSPPSFGGGRSPPSFGVAGSPYRGGVLCLFTPSPSKDNDRDLQDDWREPVGNPKPTDGDSDRELQMAIAASLQATMPQSHGKADVGTPWGIVPARAVAAVARPLRGNRRPN